VTPSIPQKDYEVGDLHSLLVPRPLLILRSPLKHPSSNSFEQLRTFFEDASPPSSPNPSPVAPVIQRPLISVPVYIPTTATTTLRDPATVVEGQSLPYWCGRFMALSDRVRSKALDDNVDPTDDEFGDTTYNRRNRCRKVFAELYSWCDNDEATSSLQHFHAFSKSMHARSASGDEESIAAPVPWSDVCALGELERSRRLGMSKRGSWIMGDDEVSLSAGRKATLMGRLLGQK